MPLENDVSVKGAPFGGETRVGKEIKELSDFSLKRGDAIVSDDQNIASLSRVNLTKGG
jgi:hypothetical protein